MSFDAVLKVLNHSESEGRSRLVLLSLASYANEWDESYPAVKSMGKHAHMSARSVQRSLRDLEELGEITDTSKKSEYGTRVYRLTLLSRCQSDTGANSVAKSDSPGAGGATPLAPEPTTKPPEEPPMAGAGEQTALLPDPTTVVWEHFQRVIPGGDRYKLDPRRKLLIKRALGVRTVDECCSAITRLSQSGFHLGDNDRKTKYLDIDYALGRKTDSPDATIDKWNASATDTRAFDGVSDNAQRRVLAVPADRRMLVNEHIRKVRARFANPQHEPTVRIARESEAALREYPGVEPIENADGTLGGWRCVDND